jgi:hypothetical protein
MEELHKTMELVLGLVGKLLENLLPMTDDKNM